jgi:glycosyltransferase involved in cell wall biosynthesis
LLSDPGQRERLSANAQRVVRERFLLERMLEATEQVYRDVVEKSSRESTQPLGDVRDATK